MYINDDWQFTRYEHEKINEYDLSCSEGMIMFKEVYDLYKLFSGEIYYSARHSYWDIVSRQKATTYYKYGFKDMENTKVIPAMYSHVESFNEGLACVCKRIKLTNKTAYKWGYIDRTGRPIIPFIFDSARSFSEGRAAIKIKDHWAFIDRYGDLVSDILYEELSDFKDGIAIVKQDGKFGIMNINCNFIHYPCYDEISDLQHNSYFVVVCAGKKGCLDSKCMPILHCKYDDIRYDSIGMFIVTLDEKKGLIDIKGNNVTECEFDYISYFSENIIGVAKKATGWGFINHEGTIILDCICNDVGHFEDGIAYIKIHNLWGIVDKEGTIILDCICDDIGNFENRVACVRINKLWGLIDKQGHFLIEPKFQNVWYQPFPTLKEDAIKKLSEKC